MPNKTDPFRLAVGTRLEALRVARGYDTIRSFSRFLDVEEDRYTKWARGKAMVPPQIAQRLKTEFGVTADWLYFGDASTLPIQLYNELKAA